MPSESLLQLRAVILHPAPDRSVIDMETPLLQQLLNIAQRERIAEIPPDRTEYEAGFGLSPYEDRGSGSHFAILSRHQPATLNVATHPMVSSICKFDEPTYQRSSSFGLGLSDGLVTKNAPAFCDMPFPNYWSLADMAVLIRSTFQALKRCYPLPEGKGQPAVL
jgi:hypothetical protein